MQSLKYPFFFFFLGIKQYFTNSKSKTLLQPQQIFVYKQPYYIQIVKEKGLLDVIII